MSDFELTEKFNALTPAQHRMMAFQDSRTSKPSTRTIAKLVSAGLIEKCGDHYEVPLGIHAQYCSWCHSIYGGES